MIRCRFLILLVESWRIVVISGTVHWFDLKTSFHPLLWTSSGLKGTWKLSTYIGLGSLRCAKGFLNQYKCLVSRFPSDLKKSTVVDESLSSNQTNVLFNYPSRLHYDVAFCVLWHLMFLMAVGKAEKCLAGCQVIKHKSNKCFYSTNHLGALDCRKQGGHACIGALRLGKGIRGACFQAPRATPWQRQMEMHRVSLIIVFYFSVLLQQDHLGMYKIDNHIIKE